MAHDVIRKTCTACATNVEGACVGRYETKLKISKVGVCSAYLTSLASLPADAPKPRLPIWLSEGSLRLPKQPAAPIIMVGPGTGVAPFRSFLEDRQVVRREGAEGVGEAVLFFGCRNRAADFYFEPQWADSAPTFSCASVVLLPVRFRGLRLVGLWVAVLKDGSLAGLHTAFSRDGPNKIYVQQRIKDAGSELWPLLAGDGEGRPPATVYVAGSSTNMPAAVRRAFVSVCEKAGGLGPEAAEAFVRAMEKHGRYQTETWA